MINSVHKEIYGVIGDYHHWGRDSSIGCSASFPFVSFDFTLVSFYLDWIYSGNILLVEPTSITISYLNQMYDYFHNERAEVKCINNTLCNNKTNN